MSSRKKMYSNGMHLRIHSIHDHRATRDRVKHVNDRTNFRKDSEEPCEKSEGIRFPYSTAPLPLKDDFA